MYQHAMVNLQLNVMHACMVHEARGIVQACQTWPFYLMKRKFIIATDNKPVASLFTDSYKKLNAITQRQLLRLRVMIRPFSFEIRHVPGINNELADGLSRNYIKIKEELKIEDKIEPIISKDTNTPLLDETELKRLEKETFKLRQEQFELEKHKIPNDTTINTLNLDITGDLTYETKETIINNVNILDLHAMLDDSSVINKYKQIMKEERILFDNLLKNYRTNASYVESERIGLLVNSANESNLLFNDENVFNTPAHINLVNKIEDITYDLNKVSYNGIKVFNNITNEVFQNELVRKHKLMSNTDVHVNLTQYMMPMQTRSKTRAKRMANKKKEIYRVDFVYPEFDDINYRMKLRSEFMKNLFGYQNKLDIFNVKKFVEYQKSDNILKLIRFQLKQEDKDRDKLDLDLIKEYSLDYHTRLLHNNGIRINKKTDILQTMVRDELAKNKWIWVDIVPFVLIGKLIDYAHHNIKLQHFHWKQTYDNLASKYYWHTNKITMKRDVRVWCERCVVCHYVKGGIKHRAPMQIRTYSEPRDHLMMDFLGPILKNYYILVIIDYCTGYVMLVPCTGCDAKQIIESLTQQWIPIFGNFTKMETDYGSGFNSLLVKMINKAFNIKQEFSEPRNHRSTGKVERVIGFIQTIMQRFNIQSDEKLSDTNNNERA